jgi:hypothetical protein
MEMAEITRYVATTFDGVDVVIGDQGIALGDTFFIYDPERNLDDKQRFPFATIVTKDYGDFDNSSNLDRPGIFRLNVGVSRDTFRSLFPDSDVPRDYTVLDRLLPHPVYAVQSWVCVLNPSAETFERIRPLLAEAYERVVKRINPRLADNPT